MSSSTRRSSQVVHRQSSLSSLTRKSFQPDRTTFRVSEVVPDSEEERLNEALRMDGKVCRPKALLSVNSDNSDTEEVTVPAFQMKKPQPSQEVIVISSDSDEEVPPPPRRKRTNWKVMGDPFVDNERSPRKNMQGSSSVKATSTITEEILVVSDIDEDEVPSLPASPQLIDAPHWTSGPDPFDPDACYNDDAIMTFDPHARARPILRTPTSNNRRSTRSNRNVSVTDAATPTTSRSRKKVSAEQQHLDHYAKTLFAELNTAVFGNGIPAETELKWNVRLSTTAGRAFYHRDNQRRVTTRIELSSKVVDCEERVRNTLSHEMCHLAVWILDNNPEDAGHGPSFKAWTMRVMNERPEISINTRHSYEINYKFKWECTRCGKIYGRHSKSIDITKNACGVCNPPGSLRALFETPAKRSSKKSATTGSKLAAGSPRASPRRIDASPTKSKPAIPLSTRRTLNVPSSSDDEVEELIQNLHLVSISSKE